MKAPFYKYLSLLAVFLCWAGLSVAQSPSSSAGQIDPDWERIRDAQVQMLKKKEQELDRLKEELLSRAQPQSATLTADMQAEMQKKEQAWASQIHNYENEISLLRMKAEEQKKEIDALKFAPSGAPAAVSDPAQSQNEDKLREYQTQIDAKQTALNELQAQLENQRKDYEARLAEASKNQAAQFVEKQKEIQNKEEELARIKSDFEKQLAEFESKIKSEENRLDEERRTNLEERNQNETEKRALAEMKQKLEQELAAAKKNQDAGASVQAEQQALTQREADMITKEKALSAKIAETSDRERRIAESQKQLVEERRKWQIERNQLNADLEKKFSQADSRLETADKFDMQLSRVKAGYEKQLQEIRETLQAEKDKSAQSEIELKEKTREFAQTQKNFEKQIEEMKVQAAGSASAKESELSRRVDDLSQKLSAAESEKKRLQSELDQLKSSSASAASQAGEASKLKSDLEELNAQKAQREKEWQTEKENYEKAAAEMRGKIADFSSGFETKELELQKKLISAEEKVRAAEQNNKELSEAMKSASVHTGDVKLLKEENARFEAEVSSLKSQIDELRKNSATTGNEELLKEIKALQHENEDWRANSHKNEKAWSEFVNRETQYQMEINALRQQLAAASTQSGGRNWNSEAKRVVEERRALSDERTQMYRELTQERQKLEQEQVQFLRRQREFEKFAAQEQSRLERQRR